MSQHLGDRLHFNCYTLEQTLKDVAELTINIRSFSNTVALLFVDGRDVPLAIAICVVRWAFIDRILLFPNFGLLLRIHCA